jgi:hypothetical protein
MNSDLERGGMGGIYFLYQNSRIEFLAEANRHYKREQLLNWVIDLVLRKRIQCKILAAWGVFYPVFYTGVYKLLVRQRRLW